MVHRCAVNVRTAVICIDAALRRQNQHGLNKSEESYDRDKLC